MFLFNKKIDDPAFKGPEFDRWVAHNGTKNLKALELCDDWEL